jgi:triphosphatase
MTELELKFQIDPQHRAAVASALQPHASARVRLQAHYHDSVDGCLARHGLSLRLRKEGQRWVQTLKAAGPGAIDRLEENAPVPGRWGERGPDLDLRRHEGTRAGALLQDALSERGGAEPAALARVYSTDVWRRVVRVAAPDCVVELAFDEGRVIAGSASAPICELEYELKEGAPEGMVALAKQGVREHGLWLSTISKAQRGERLARQDAHGPAVRARAPALDERMPGSVVVRAVVSACLAQVLANASEVAAGSRHEEHIHQLRIGIRRLRTALRELGDLSPDIDGAWEAPLVATFRALGTVRDEDAVARSVGPQLQAAGAPTLQWEHGAQPAADPGEAVRAAAFQNVLLDLWSFTMARPRADTDPDARAVRDHVRGRLGKLHAQAVQGGKRFESLDEAAQHRVRKRLKRLRYLSEFVAPLYAKGAVQRYLRRLGPAQDALGAHNDNIVAARMYREAAEHGNAQAWFAAGWLKAHQVDTARACSKALAKVARAARFWK